MYYQQDFDYQLYNLRQYEKKNISHIGKACGGAIVAFAGLGLVVSFVMFSIKGFENLYETNGIFSIAFNSIIFVFTLFMPFYVAYRSLNKKNIISELPLGEPYDKTDFALLIPISIMVCIIGSIFTGVLSTVVDTVFGIEFTQPDDVCDYTTIKGIIVALFGTAVVPAFIEEFAIRGVVLQSLRKYGDKFAILMSSFVFALMHGNMVQIPFAFIAGIALGYCAVKTGSLWTGIAVHFINNSIAVFSMVATEKLSEQGSNTFAMILYAVVFVAGGICLFIYLNKNKGVPTALFKGNIYYLKTSEKIKSFICNVPMALSIAILVAETALYINNKNG